MKYMKQLNEFFSTLDYKPLSANAIAIYLFLLHIANKTGWLEEFRVANSILMSKCRLNISALQRAKNELIVQEYISYKKGKNQNDAPKYKINKLYFEQADEQANEQPIEQTTEQATEQASEHTGEHINIQYNTKHIKKNIKKKFEPPSLEDVQNYIKEKKLKVDGIAFFNYFKEGNWIDSNGKKVNNWKQKLLTWNRYAATTNNQDKKVGYKNYEQRQYDNLDRLYVNR